MVTIECNARIRYASYSNFDNLSVIPAELQQLTDIWLKVFRKLIPVEGNHHFFKVRSVGLVGRESGSLRFSHLHSDNGIFKAGNDLPSTAFEFQRITIQGGIED